MHSKTILAALFFTVVATVHPFPAPTALAKLPSDWPHTGSDLKPDPKVMYGTLETGLRYAIRPNQTPAGQASIRLLIDVGSKHEYDTERGIAHFIEHMAFNGTKNVPEGELVKLLERHGLAFGADANAYTSYDHTVYQLDLPNLKTEVLDTAFLLMRETAGNILFESEAIERERGVVLAEKRRENVHARRSSDARLAFTYPGTRLLNRMPIGTEEGISTFTRQQMVTFYQQFYRPENAFLVIVGDIDVEEIERRVKSSFSDWHAVGAARDLQYSIDTADYLNKSPQVEYLHNKQDRTNISITVSQEFKEQNDNRFNRIEGLFDFAGNSILSQRLQNRRMDGEAAYLGAGASSNSFNKIATSAYLGLFLEEDKWQPGLRDALIELKKAILHGFTEVEVAELLANLRTNFEYRVSAADDQQSAALASSILASFASNTVFTPPSAGLDLFSEFEQQMSLEKINTQFRKQWSAAAPKLFFISPEKIAGAEEQLLKTYQSAMATEVLAPKAQEIAEFAYTSFGPAGQLVAKDHQQQLDFYSVRFANNVMLNIKKTDLQKETVHLSMRFGGGILSAPKDKPGLMTLLNGTFGNGGLGKHTATELRKILAGRTVSASFGSSNDSFHFRSAVTPKDTLLQLQLWAAYLSDPGYRSEPIEHYQQSVEALFHALENTPGQVVRYQVGKHLYSGDPRFFLPSKAAIQSLKAVDLKAFFSSELGSSAIEISIVGDIDIEDTIGHVAQTLGALPVREKAPKPHAEARRVSFPEPGSITLFHKGDVDQGVLQLYWPTIDYSDVSLSAQLDLLRSVLSNRLREAVREDLGASYAPSVSNLESNVFPGYGYFAFGVDAQPDDMEQITAIVHQEISDLLLAGIEKDELERARRPLIESIENAEKHNGHWLNRISQAQTQPETLHHSDTVKSTWITSTSQDLIDLANKYLKPHRTFQIKVVPYPED